MPPQMMLMRTSRASVDTLGTLSYATTGNVESNAPFTFPLRGSLEFTILSASAYQQHLVGARLASV